MKKKILTAVLAAVLAASAPLAYAVNNALSVTANAADILTEGDYKYSVNEDGETVTITGYTGTDAEVVIPGTLDGKTVTTIGRGAFAWSSFTSVVIPDSVTTIGASAFENCLSLTSVTIPDSVTTIGYYAFDKCKSLTSVIIPDSVTTIYGNPFGGCTSLTSVDISEDNKSYSSVDGVLFNVDKSELVTYPIGKKDKSYTIPDSVTLIREHAFEGCTSLTSVTIPDSVSTIGYSAFQSCTSLISITIPDSVVKIDEGTFNGCISLTSVIIPDSVTTICAYAFMGCTSLSNVTIPDGVTIIDASVFHDCESITNITIPDTVTIIGGWAFAGCTSLTNITIPDTVTTIDGYAFGGCTSLTSITIPDSVATIDEGTFSYCISLTSVTIPDSVTLIGNGAFYDCTSLETVNYGGTKAEWEAIEINEYNEYNEYLTNAEIIFTENDTSEPATDDTSEPTTSDTSELATSNPATDPTESTVTPGETDPVSEPDSSTGEPTVLEATLKNVDSENGIEGEALDKLLFGDSGWTWEQVEKIEFASDDLFSVQFKNDSGEWVKLGEEAAARAEDGNIWSTAWTLTASEMGKTKYAKVIAKDGTADVTAKIYIKSGAEKPSGEKPGTDQANTGIALAIAPAVLAASAAIVVAKKKK